MTDYDERSCDDNSKMVLISDIIIVFFFKQKTAYEILTCDWSSDVCSSDLEKWSVKK